MKRRIACLLVVVALLLSARHATSATTPLPGALLPRDDAAPNTSTGEQRTVYSPTQATTLAQTWVQIKSNQINEWRGATVGPPMLYYDLAGTPVAYAFSVIQGRQDAGYLILTYEVRDYPLIEFSPSPAPHLRCADDCQKRAADRGLALAEMHPIYLGPLDYAFEAVPALPAPRDSRRWLVPMNGSRVIEITHSPSSALSPDKVATTISALDEMIRPLGTAGMIYGVPDYNQFYGPSYGYDFKCLSGCTPSAATNIAVFWANAGYPNLGNANWRDTTADLFHRIETFCIGGDGSTWTHTVSPGLVSFAQARGYDFHSLQYCWPTSFNWVGCNGREFTWERYTTEIEGCRPPLLSIFNHPFYGAHSVTGVGYDTSGGRYYIVHDTWGSTVRKVWVLHEDVDRRYRFIYPFIPPAMDHTPPDHAQVNELPKYQFSHSFVASWSGSDVFPGVGSYDLQYRDGIDGAWQWWLRGATDTSAPLSKDVPLQKEHTYHVRVRARDKHCNVGAWSAPSNGVTIPRHSVSGRVTGNQGQPAFQARVNSPNAYASTVVRSLGDYTLFFPLSETVDITAHPSSGPSTLPALRGVLLATGTLHVTGIDLVLPPPDNALRNSHFEDPDPSADWTLDGIAPPVLSPQAHTGHHAIALGELPDTPSHKLQGGTQKSGYRVDVDEWYWTISQTVTIAATVTQPTLSWLYAIGGTAGASDTLEVTIERPGEPSTYTIPLRATGWRHAWLALNDDTIDQQITISFSLRRPPTTDALLVLLDEVTLGSGEEGPSLRFLPVIAR